MLMLDEDAPLLAMPLAFASLSDRSTDALRERARQAARAMTASDVTYDGEFDVIAASLLIRTFGEKMHDDARRAIIADAERSPWSFFFSIHQNYAEKREEQTRTEIESDGSDWRSYPNKIAELTDAVFRSLDAAATVIADLGADRVAALYETTRNELIQSAVRKSYSATQAIADLGAGGFAALPEPQRNALLMSAAGAPASAVRAIDALGANRFSALDETTRNALMQSVARCLASEFLTGAFRTIDALSNALTAAERTLLRSALMGDDAAIHVARAMHEGAPWRDWMRQFVPDAHTSDAASADSKRSHAERRM